MSHISSEFELMPWTKVTEEWNRMSGENITRNAVLQIAQRAEDKLRKGLEDIARDRGLIKTANQTTGDR